jgi:hypothetical protein
MKKKGNQFRAPENQLDALVLALKLAITATNKQRTDMAVDLANDLSAGLSEFEIARCKKRALNELETNSWT